MAPILASTKTSSDYMAYEHIKRPSLGYELSFGNFIIYSVYFFVNNQGKQHRMIKCRKRSCFLRQYVNLASREPPIINRP